MVGQTPTYCVSKLLWQLLLVPSCNSDVLWYSNRSEESSQTLTVFRTWVQICKVMSCVCFTSHHLLNEANEANEANEWWFEQKIWSSHVSAPLTCFSAAGNLKSQQFHFMYHFSFFVCCELFWMKIQSWTIGIVNFSDSQMTVIQTTSLLKLNCLISVFWLTEVESEGSEENSESTNETYQSPAKSP